MAAKMKKYREGIILGLVVVVASVFLTSGGVDARIPEPDNIIYGIAGTDVDTVTLKVDDEPISTYTMGDNPDAGDYYILRVPMDALEPAEPGSAHSGDEVYIYFNDETDPAASITLGERGTIYRLDFETADDTDSDGLPDNWEQSIVDADPNDAVTSIDDVLPGDDFDGDGEINATEYSNGTDPTDARSTNDPSNAYAAFHFEIYRGASQTEAGEFTPSFWGAHLICWPRESETLMSAALTKPTAGGGDETFLLSVTAQGDEAKLENEDYDSVGELMADLVPGDYWVDLELYNGGVDTYHLRFKLSVPGYTEASFPDHITVEAPSPYATRVSLRPLLDFDSEVWDYLFIARVDTEEEVYLHIHDANDDPADRHQVPSEDSLRPITQYYVVVDTSDWGNTWLGSRTAIEIETARMVMPWLPLLLFD